MLYTNEDLEGLFIKGTFCGRLDCSACGPYRMLVAQNMARAGSPERILTMTIRPRPWLSVPQAIKWIRQKFCRLAALIRAQFGHFEYIAFVELTKQGTPHLHVLTRGTFISQRWLSARWLKLTGSFKVHIQQVRKGHRSIREATKYYLKTARALADKAPGVKIYTTSRDWVINKEDPDKPPAGPYTFYAFAAVGWDEARDMVAVLGGSIAAVAGDCRTWRIDFARPPNPQTVLDIIAWGDPGECQLASAIDAYFQDPSNARETLATNRELDDIERFGPGADWDRVAYDSEISAPADVAGPPQDALEVATVPLF